MAGERSRCGPIGTANPGCRSGACGALTARPRPAPTLVLFGPQAVWTVTLGVFPAPATSQPGHAGPLFYLPVPALADGTLAAGAAGGRAAAGVGRRTAAMRGGRRLVRAWRGRVRPPWGVGRRRRGAGGGRGLAPLRRADQGGSARRPHFHRRVRSAITRFCEKSPRPVHRARPAGEPAPCWSRGRAAPPLRTVMRAVLPSAGDRRGPGRRLRASTPAVRCQGVVGASFGVCLSCPGPGRVPALSAALILSPHPGPSLRCPLARGSRQLEDLALPSDARVLVAGPGRHPGAHPCGRLSVWGA